MTVSSTDWGYETSSRKYTRGRNRLPKLVQTIAPSIPFPGRRFISPVCTPLPSYRVDLHLAKWFLDNIYNLSCKKLPRELYSTVTLSKCYKWFHIRIFCQSDMFIYNEIHGAAMRGSRLKKLLLGFIGLYVVALIGIFINLTWEGVGIDERTFLDTLLNSGSNQDSVNPFLSDERKPRRSYVRDQRMRDSVLRLEFNISQVSFLPSILKHIGHLVNCTGRSNWSQHRKLKYYICCLRDVIQSY